MASEAAEADTDGLATTPWEDIQIAAAALRRSVALAPVTLGTRSAAEAAVSAAFADDRRALLGALTETGDNRPWRVSLCFRDEKTDQWWSNT